MTLRKRQSLFVQLIGELIEYVYANGWELTFGDAARMDNKGHRKGSFHYSRLAIDLNLFVNSKYVTMYTSEWERIGRFWELLHPDCTWGGRFANQDPNHLSFGEKKGV